MVGPTSRWAGPGGGGSGRGHGGDQPGGGRGAGRARDDGPQLAFGEADVATQRPAQQRGTPGSGLDGGVEQGERADGDGEPSDGDDLGRRQVLAPGVTPGRAAGQRRGTATPTVAGAGSRGPSDQSPCHQTAAAPTTTAPSPAHSAAARTRASSVSGRPAAR